MAKNDDGLTVDDLKAALAEAVAMAMVANSPKQGLSPSAEAKLRAAGPRCQECGQFEVACQKKHRQAVVFPSTERYAKWFNGVALNGIVYQSPNRHTALTVPESANVEYIVAQWENKEADNYIQRQNLHNSGSVSPNGTNFAAWRAI